ncbi:hypothetical protein GZH53_17485 [Flavihumibacter sp. R14]|nr:hypothetical protein [Flavihumibacter soli]
MEKELATKAGETNVPTNTAKKKYYTVTIPQSLISEYLNLKGVRIVLSFRDGSGNHVPLIFTGFDQNQVPIITKELEQKGNDFIDSRNVFFGIIFKDSNGTLLHDLFTSGAGKDWILTPEPYGTKGDYVSYDLAGVASLGVIKLNPSPPA